MRKARRPRQAGVVDPFPEDQYNNDEFETEEKKDLGNIFSSLGTS